MIEARRPMMWPRQSMTTSFSNISTKGVKKPFPFTKSGLFPSFDSLQLETYLILPHSTCVLRNHRMVHDGIRTVRRACSFSHLTFRRASRFIQDIID